MLEGVDEALLALQAWYDGHNEVRRILLRETCHPAAFAAQLEAAATQLRSRR